MEWAWWREKQRGFSPRRRRPLLRSTTIEKRQDRGNAAGHCASNKTASKFGSIKTYLLSRCISNNMVTDLKNGAGHVIYTIAGIQAFNTWNSKV